MAQEEEATVVSSPSGKTPSSSDDRPTGRPHVLVLGGGFGGIGAARKLKKADVDVTLVDKHDYHTFQPMLYQVATARGGRGLPAGRRRSTSAS
jgi:NADPH-dependent 2,4-dienoyl-CoA reductase/sulfur reductase-like enzyme